MGCGDKLIDRKLDCRTFLAFAARDDLVESLARRIREGTAERHRAPRGFFRFGEAPQFRQHMGKVIQGGGDSGCFCVAILNACAASDLRPSA